MTKAASRSLSDWLRSRSHLPKYLKDFHDAKTLFKCLGSRITRQHQAIKDSEDWKPLAMPDPVAAHIYTLDCFLWFMARHGYVLQRVRSPRDSRPQFHDLGETLKGFEDRELEEFRGFIEQERPAEKRGRPWKFG